MLTEIKLKIFLQHWYHCPFYFLHTSLSRSSGNVFSINNKLHIVQVKLKSCRAFYNNCNENVENHHETVLYKTVK